MKSSIERNQDSRFPSKSLSSALVSLCTCSQKSFLHHKSFWHEGYVLKGNFPQGRGKHSYCGERNPPEKSIFSPNINSYLFPPETSRRRLHRSCRPLIVRRLRRWSWGGTDVRLSPAGSEECRWVQGSAPTQNSNKQLMHLIVTTGLWAEVMPKG